LEPVRAGQMHTQEESLSKQAEPVMTPQPVNHTPAPVEVTSTYMFIDVVGP